MNLQSIKQLIAKHNLQPGRPVLRALLLTALAVAVLAGSALAAAGNLVKNGSFEKDSDHDGIPNSWTGSSLTLADKRVCNQSKAGACSFKMVADGSAKELSQEIAVTGLAGDEFNLSAWVRGKTIGVVAGDYPRVQVFFNLTGGGTNGWYVNIPDGTYTWTLRQESSVQASGDYDSITIIINQFVTNSGKMWMDKVKLVPVP